MLKASTRQSIYRILSDLVKSDNVITVDELDELKKACDKFHISPSDEEEGYRMDLGTALKNLSGQGERTKKALIGTMKDIALKDGECCRQESLLITAAEYVCSVREVGNSKARVVSMEFRNRPLLTKQLLYVENRTSSPARAALDSDYEGIAQIVKMGGMDLIYVPRIALRFREYEYEKNGGIVRDNKKREDLKRMLHLVSPTSNDGDIENTITAIQGMNSKSFYNIILNGKLEMGLKVEDPCWMLRLPDSVVAGKGYANFFFLDVERDIRSQLSAFVERINIRQNAYTITINDGRGKEGIFAYDGFYKALLDVMTVRKVDKWDLYVRLYGEGVEPFVYDDPITGTKKKCTVTIRRGGDEYPVSMSGRDVAFYLLLLCASASKEGGLDFKNGERVRTEDRYAAIYGRVSRREKECPMVWDPAYRIPMRCRVAKAINESEVAKNSTIQALYLPYNVEGSEDGKKCGLIRVGIEPERVFIESLSGTTTLTESGLFKNCFLAK